LNPARGCENSSYEFSTRRIGTQADDFVFVSRRVEGLRKQTRAGRLVIVRYHPGKMDWVFNQWVYGTEVPSYQLAFTLKPQSDGSVVMDGNLGSFHVTQVFALRP
jgi:hypothetical protein